MTVPAVALFEQGYTELVSVIPPNAPLSPGSKITPTQRGKTPGRKLANGTWAGYDWLRSATSLDHVKQWAQDGANLGLLAARFPAVDIDCTDERLSRELVAIAHRVLGPAPVRVGLAPKALLPYRLEGEPFSRMALLIRPDGEGPTKPVHLLEVLGAGRQYLIHGTHPSGSPYRWSEPLPPPTELSPLRREDVERFFAEVTGLLEILPGYVVERVGDGGIRALQDAPAQTSLEAPSLELLEQAIKFIPNPATTSRDDYIKIGYAIRAAWPADEEAAFACFADWASLHEGRSRGELEQWRADWRRMRPPYTVGYAWLASVARTYGFVDAGADFDAVEATRAAVAEVEQAAIYSDKWLADRVIEEHYNVLRFVPASGVWHVWNEGRWQKDAVNLAQFLVSQTLERLSARLCREGVTDKEKREALVQARRIASAYCRDSVLKFVESDPRITIRPEAFDADPWILNTPAGILDLRTGDIGPHDPAALCSKMTSVAPDFSAPHSEWTRFLIEATDHRGDVISYLQRVAGYCLGGDTSEQAFWMIWGPGGNGKSVFLNVLTGILGDYARTAPMDTFTASSNERHPTELAMLLGARLVSATETQANRRWDEARVKGLTGGDLVSARFMRQDFFTYRPQFKLVFVGNHKPALSVVDQAIKRRIHIVPFTVTPKTVDPQLATKLREEWPAILGWMIAGSREWQQRRLHTPSSVAEATDSYFEEQDAIGRWMDEATIAAPDEFHTSEELYASWREWAGANGEYPGKLRTFVQQLLTKGLVKDRDSKSRRHGFRGRRVLFGFHTESVL